MLSKCEIKGQSNFKQKLARAMSYGKYKNIGSGSFGVVISMKSRHKQGHIAVKVQLDDDETFPVDIWENERDAISTLCSDETTGVVQASIHKCKCDTTVIIMDRANFSLDEFIYKKHLQDINRRMAIEILCGLNFIYEKGYIHGDISSGNILVYLPKKDKIPSFKLADFGNAHKMNTPPPDHSSTTLPYASPEQLYTMYGDEVDEEKELWDGASQSDEVWSLGVILREAINMEAEFDKDTVWDVLIAQHSFLGISSDDPLPDGFPRVVKKDFELKTNDNFLVDFTSMALQRSRHRPASATEMLFNLQKYFDKETFVVREIC